MTVKIQHDLVRKRMVDRQNHFMGPDLLASQLETLEEPNPNEENSSQSKVVTISLVSETGQPKTPEQMVDEAINELSTKVQIPTMAVQSSDQSSPSLPSLQSLFLITESDKLAEVLALLFEVSDSIKKTLIPILQKEVQERPLSSYSELIDRCEDIVKNQFSRDEQVNFLGSHPRIGEVKGLSKLSSKEQGNQTHPDILARLEVI